MGVLRVVAGRATAPEFEVGEGVTIGRGEEATIRLYDETSSRRHAEVRPRDGGYVVRDLGSSNGTYLNGSRVGEHALVDGDEIVIGATRLRFGARGTGSRDTVVVAETPGGRVASTLREADLHLDPGAKGMGAVYEAGRALAGALDVDEWLTRLAAAVSDALRPDRAAALLLDGEEVTARAVKGDGQLVLSRTILGRLCETREGLLVADIPSDPRFRSRESLVGADVRSVCCAPVVLDGRVAAVAYAERGQGRGFTEADLAVAVALARDAAPSLRTARAVSTERERVVRLEGALADGEAIVGNSPALKRVLDMVERAAPTDATVCIRGETGTGKELVARALHRQSPRRPQPFLAVNCAALVGTLLESELFGYEKGAFTGALRRTPGKFEAAHGGTLFLDEVGEMALETQAALLRAVQEREFYRVGGTRPVEVDIRLVAATNKDLAAEVKAGRFREDLYYRLSVVTIDVPPLRERLDDIPALVEHLLRRILSRAAKRAPAIPREIFEAFRTYPWPGNIRELANLLERAVVLAPGPTLTLDLFPPELRGAARPLAGPASAGPPEVITIKEAERRAIIAALRHTGWKKGETAGLLEISWPTLNKKIEDYGISREETQ